MATGDERLRRTKDEGRRTKVRRFRRTANEAHHTGTERTEKPEKGDERQDSSPETDPQQQSAIKKGIYFTALLYVEGEQAPAENFDPVAERALKTALDEALKGEHDGLSISLKKLEVKNDVEQEEDEEQQEEKFQF